MLRERRITLVFVECNDLFLNADYEERVLDFPLCGANWGHLSARLRTSGLLPS